MREFGNEIPYDIGREYFCCQKEFRGLYLKECKAGGAGRDLPRFETIYNGMSVQGIKVSDIAAVNNLKHAWQFMLDSLDYPFVWKINQCMGSDNLIIRAGYLQNVPADIGGTT